MIIELTKLRNKLEGDLFWDSIHRTIYSTDASVYKEEPVAVAFPRSTEDLVSLIHFAREEKTSLIPRTAGTSLAGQVVGKGIIVDFSRYLNRILEVNKEERWVWVEPGVVLDELNQELRKYGLFFGPETSTANRCMVGGMLGNNACGLHSLVYGSTRDHTLEVEGIMSDGSTAIFKALSPDQFEKKLNLAGIEGDIYRGLNEVLLDPDNAKNIREGFPDPSIPRRNTGYALDLLLNSSPYNKSGEDFNLSKLIGGSEGTLVIAGKIKLNLLPLPPREKALICAHFNTLRESLLANIVALKNEPTAVELMDSAILDCARSNKAQLENSFFIDGHPETILIIEHHDDKRANLDKKINKTIEAIKASGYGYSYPVVYGSDCDRVWNLRKAGLGLLANIPGDAKSVSVIEDTAVPVEKLPDYINDVEAVFDKMGLDCVYHAHVGSGELHMRPLLNLKNTEDIQRFKEIATEIVRLVKKYRGSLSGEHGDGRLRTPFIPDILGKENYELIGRVKRMFDPDGIFNPGKIVNSQEMNTFLRYYPGQLTKEISTTYDFSKDLGIVRAIEKCNGSGDCLKSHKIGGTMCPSYQATRDERNSTRARSNILREFINQDNLKNPFDHREIYEILDLCLSCKACKSECPSSVDMAKLKGEFLQNWYDSHGIPLRTRIISKLSLLNKAASIWPGLANTLLRSKGFVNLFKKFSGFALKRSLPEISETRTDKWAGKNLLSINPSSSECLSEVCLFIDEFTNYNDAEIGIKSIKLLTRLGYKVVLAPLSESGRAYMSKGLLKKARKLAIRNVQVFSTIIDKNIPLVGIEPSAILSFRDEYPDLMPADMRAACKNLADNTFMIDEFLKIEIEKGNISKESFSDEHVSIKLHGHCQQKAVASTNPTKFVLAFPENHSVEEINSGCCGMAGSFGYEKEHFDLSMKVGELVLFPEIRKTKDDIIICAYGTSCRHQIKDGTGRKSYHPVEILYDALREGDSGN